MRKTISRALFATSVRLCELAPNGNCRAGELTHAVIPRLQMEVQQWEEQLGTAEDGEQYAVWWLREVSTGRNLVLTCRAQVPRGKKT